LVYYPDAQLPYVVRKNFVAKVLNRRNWLYVKI
jgi:hypothetical protein